MDLWNELPIDYITDYIHYNKIDDCVIQINESQRQLYSILTLESHIDIETICKNILQKLSSTNIIFVRSFIEIRNELLDVKNLTGLSAREGGTSSYSEYLAYEVLFSIFNAYIIKNECQISYLNTWGKKTDMIILLKNILIAVSVTRAMNLRGHYGTSAFTLDQGKILLDKKITGIYKSNENVDTTDKYNRWCHHILFIWCEDDCIVKIMQQLILSKKLDNITILLVTHDYEIGTFIY